MSIWQGRLGVFDLETTGVDVEHSRIVSACVAVLEADGAVVARWDWLADPGVEIPEAASAVHGITTERAQLDGRPAGAVVAEIGQTLRVLFDLGLPLVVYNAPYDLSLLDRESRRHRLDPIELPTPVIDPLVIDKALDRYRKGKRTLVAAAERYGVSLDDAHDAGADAIAAGRVVQAIARAFPDELDIAVADLHGRQEIWYREQAESFQAYIREAKGDENYIADASWPLRPLDDPMAFEDTQPIPIPPPRPGLVPIIDFSEFRPRELSASPVRAVPQESVVDMIAEDDLFEEAEIPAVPPTEYRPTINERDALFDALPRFEAAPSGAIDIVRPAVAEGPVPESLQPPSVEPGLIDLGSLASDAVAHDMFEPIVFDDDDDDDHGPDEPERAFESAFDDERRAAETAVLDDPPVRDDVAEGFNETDPDLDVALDDQPAPPPPPATAAETLAAMLSAEPGSGDGTFAAATSSAPPPAAPRPTVLRIAAAIVTDPAGRGLLVRKAGSTVFMQPGGKIEPGESALAALTRELAEELGLVVDPAATEYIGSFRAEAANEPNTIVRAEVFYFSTSVVPLVGAEIEELLWIDSVDDVRVELAPLTRDELLPLWAERRPTLF